MSPCKCVIRRGSATFYSGSVYVIFDVKKGQVVKMYVLNKGEYFAAYAHKGRPNKQVTAEHLEAIRKYKKYIRSFQSSWLAYTALLLVVLLISAGGVFIARSKFKSATNEIDWTTQQLADKLASGQAFRLIDVREPEEYAAGHIPGAELMPLGRLAEYFDQLKQDEEMAVICRSGIRSQQAVLLLRQHGYTKVHNVVGGMLAWQGQVTTGMDP